MDREQAVNMKREISRRILEPYRVIAGNTNDADARAAIKGLIRMIEHAMEQMIEADALVDRPPSREEEALLDLALAMALKHKAGDVP